jgi:hypothetical protein
LSKERQSILPTIPNTREDLTPEWLSSILGLKEENQVVSVNLLPLGESDSVSGFIYRASLTYSRKPRKSPESLVLKMPHPRSKRLWWLLDAYRYEVEFYQNYAKDIGVHVPRHIYSEIDQDTCDYILVIEDFPDSENVRDETGATKEQAYLLLKYMAKLHASNWLSLKMCDEKLPTIESGVNSLNALLKKQSPILLARLGQIIEPEEKEVFRALPDGYLNAVKPLLSSPRTLVHNDFAMKNILILHESEKPSFVLVDWANIRWAPGVRDLSFFIMTSVPLSMRSTGDEEFLRYYWEMLRREGVSDYSYRQMLEDYRRSVLVDFSRMVSFGGHEVYPPMYEGILRHFIRSRTGSAKKLNLLSLLQDTSA